LHESVLHSFSVHSLRLEFFSKKAVRKIFVKFTICHPFLIVLSMIRASISSTFHEQHLSAQIPKAQKKTVKLSVFFTLLGSAPENAALRTLMKLTPDSNAEAGDGDITVVT